MDDLYDDLLLMISKDYSELVIADIINREAHYIVDLSTNEPFSNKFTLNRKAEINSRIKAFIFLTWCNPSVWPRTKFTNDVFDLFFGDFPDKIIYQVQGYDKDKFSLIFSYAIKNVLFYDTPSLKFFLFNFDSINMRSDFFTLSCTLRTPALEDTYSMMFPLVRFRYSVIEQLLSRADYNQMYNDALDFLSLIEVNEKDFLLPDDDRFELLPIFGSLSYTKLILNRFQDEGGLLTYG